MGLWETRPFIRYHNRKDFRRRLLFFLAFTGLLRPLLLLLLLL
jgi:hypothetical protein